MLEAFVDNLPSIISGAFGVIFLSIYFFERYISGKSSNKEWNAELIIGLLSFAILGVSTTVKSIQKSVCNIENSLNCKSGLPLEKLGTNPSKQFVDTLHFKVNEVIFRNSNSKEPFLYSRAQFSSVPEFGNGPEEDRSIYSLVETAQFELQYFIGYPRFSKNLQQLESEGLRIRRSKMNEFAFKYLTSARWQSEEIKKLIALDLVNFYYLHQFKYPNTWVINDNDNLQCGMCFLRGDFEGNHAKPELYELLVAEYNSVSSYIKDQHDIFVQWGKNIIREELKKEFIYREPIMIFASSDSTKLVPKSLDEIDKVYHDLLAQGNLNSEGLELSGTIKELDILIKNLKAEKNEKK